MTKWRTPEELVEFGFQHSRVVMLNEAHDGLKRCIRTREVGLRILPIAHRMGLRYLAMEALHERFAQACNSTRRVPHEPGGYLAQPEMIDLIQAALDLGLTLITYEANASKWLTQQHGLALTHGNFEGYRTELMSLAYTNWREDQQALNLTLALQSMAEDQPLLVWCGNSHHSKRRESEWAPMGFQFRQHSGIEPFVIDQTNTVRFETQSHTSNFADRYRNDLLNYGGTAGFLAEDAPWDFGKPEIADAYILSIHNELE